MNTQCFCHPHSLLSYGSSLQSLGQDERDSDAFAARLTAESNDSNEFLTHPSPMTHWTFTYFRLSLLATRNSITKMFIWESLMCAMKKLCVWFFEFFCYWSGRLFPKNSNMLDSASLFHFVLCWPAARAFCRAHRSMTCGENLLGQRHPAELRWSWAVPLWVLTLRSFLSGQWGQACSANM